MTMYAEVLLPLPLQGTFSYEVPAEMAGKVMSGHRVLVQFGKKKYYTGIVIGLSPVKPQGFEVKPIIMLLDDKPIIRHPQLKLWDWIAD